MIRVAGFGQEDIVVLREFKVGWTSTQALSHGVVLVEPPEEDGGEDIR